MSSSSFHCRSDCPRCHTPCNPGTCPDSESHTVALESNHETLIKLGENIASASFELCRIQEELARLSRALEDNHDQMANLNKLATEVEEDDEKYRMLMEQKRVLMFDTIPGLRRRLRPVKDKKQQLQREVHEMQLRRGCVCCNPELRKIATA